MSNIKIALFLFSLFISLLSCSQATINNNVENGSTKAVKINELVNLFYEYDGFNGAILVAEEGKVIFKKGFGLANMEWGIPNTATTKFQIASVTKQFTAMLILQLVTENKLDLNSTISSYLPDYPKENGDQITIHQLLTHTSGIPNANNDEKEFRPKKMVNQFANEPLKFSPGARFSYSNSGYTLLGYLIETVTGETYEVALKERIFTPLKMNNSGFYRHRPLIKQMSSGYNKGFGDYFDVDHSDESSAYAAGGIYSTVEDLFIWDQALYTDKILPKKYMDLLFTKHISDPDYGGHYGYGWELMDKPIGNTQEKVKTIGHSGSIGGYTALFTRIPSSNSTIIFLNNSGRAFLNTMTTAITGILNDTSYDFPLKPLVLFMTKVIEKDGIDKGIIYYKDHVKDSDYYVSEQELIVAGYKFLHAGNAKDASKIFKLSIEVFPDRDNPYDSYAEALMTLGKNKAAIKNYKKSLELNPNNNNAKDMLKKLEKLN